MRFEVIDNCPYKDVRLPERATAGAAGYDFFIAEDTTCPAKQITLVPTGIKAQIDHGYYLQIALRSSAPKKFGLLLANGIGIVDEDYYLVNGHIMFQVYNFSNQDVTLKKYDRIGQGVFIPYALVDNDITQTERQGGFGSTGN